MKKRPLDIRCDGGTNIGMGHVVRSVALAEMLRNHFDVCFILQETSDTVYNYLIQQNFPYRTIHATSNCESDSSETIINLRENSIVVLDGYHFQTLYQQSIRDAGHCLVAIDDLHAWHQVADVVINHAPGMTKEKYQAEAYTQFLLGNDYALVRREFYTHKKTDSEPATFNRAVISMGAGDMHNLTFRFATALLESDIIHNIHLLVSAINPHFREITELVANNPDRLNMSLDLTADALAILLQSSDLMICPASTISIESCCVGITLLTGTTAINQMDIHAGLVQHQLAFSCGNFIELAANDLVAFIHRIKNDPKKIMDHYQNQQEMYAGPCTENFLEKFLKL